MQELAPGVHVASITRVRMISHNMQPRTETAKSGATQQKQRTLPTGKLDPVFMIIALMSRCWVERKEKGRLGRETAAVLEYSIP